MSTFPAAQHSQQTPEQVQSAHVEREYGPFADLETVAGVTYDGHHIWIATGQRLLAVDVTSGQVVRTLSVLSDAGTAFDGTHLFQLAQGQINRLDPNTGAVLGSIPAPPNASGLTWAEGVLWVGSYRSREIQESNGSNEFFCGGGSSGTVRVVRRPERQ